MLNKKSLIFVILIFLACVGMTLAGKGKGSTSSSEPTSEASSVATDAQSNPSEPSSEDNSMVAVDAPSDTT